MKRIIEKIATYISLASGTLSLLMFFNVIPKTFTFYTQQVAGEGVFSYTVQVYLFAVLIFIVSALTLVLIKTKALKFK